jgi:eukaryotic-like serine/threonine-protein kinase
MVVIPDPGKPFMMGSPLTEFGREGNERQHKRRIQRTFALAAKPVTWEQYRKFDEDDVGPEFTRTADLPAVGKSWFEAAAYCNWLSQQEGIDPMQWCYDTKPPGEFWEPRERVVKLRANYLSLQGYRLPTEAEMEYAIRAGAIMKRFFGETDDLLPKYGWYLNNAQNKTWPVGSLKPNDFGLFDVQGNVFTWCQERSRFYPQGGVADDKEDLELLVRSDRRIRGGSFDHQASEVRSAYRERISPESSRSSIGFRVTRTLQIDH